MKVKRIVRCEEKKGTVKRGRTSKVSGKQRFLSSTLLLRRIGKTVNVVVVVLFLVTKIKGKTLFIEFME